MQELALNCRVNVREEVTRWEEEEVAGLRWHKVVAVSKLVADVLALEEVGLRLLMWYAAGAGNLVQIEKIGVNLTREFSIEPRLGVQSRFE